MSEFHDLAYAMIEDSLSGGGETPASALHDLFCDNACPAGAKKILWVAHHCLDLRRRFVPYTVELGYLRAWKLASVNEPGFEAKPTGLEMPDLFRHVDLTPLKSVGHMARIALQHLSKGVSPLDFTTLLRRSVHCSRRIREWDCLPIEGRRELRIKYPKCVIDYLRVRKQCVVV